MHRGLVAFAILMLVTPAVAEQYERPVWEDGAHASLVPGGSLDLLELRMWEADLRDEGPGVMLRFLMESRHSSQSGPDEIHLKGTVLGTSREVDVHLWTEDHSSWSSEQTIFLQESGAKQIDAVVEQLPYPLDAYDHDIWVFVPLSDLGVQVGQRVDGFVFDAFTVTDGTWSRVDTAPGGYWLASSEMEMPEPGAAPDNNALTLTADDIPSYFLKGAGHHLDVEGAWVDGILTLNITNPYNATEQRIDILAPEGAKALGLTPSIVKADETVKAVYQVPLRNESQQLLWDIRSHFGGVALMELKLDALPPAPEPETPEPEIVYVEVERKDPVIRDADPSPPAQDPEPQDPEGEDSPMGAVALVAVGLALVALRRRQ